MDHQPKQFAFLAELFIDFNESVDDSVVAPAPLPLKRDVGPSYFYNIYNKGSERNLCKPTYNQPKSPPDKPSALNSRVLTYLLSEHNFSKIRLKAPQSYPDFASNLNFLFNRGSPVFLLTLISISSKFPSSPILLAFCYSIGIKNLTRRVQNVRLAMSAAVGTCGDYAIYGTEAKLSKAKSQIRRESDVEHLPEPGTGLYPGQDPAESLRKG